MASRLFQKSIDAIELHGALLVYPIDNRKDPMSLWSALYPRKKMIWEWDDSADSRLATLWYLKEELSRSNQVVYGKWFKNRATFLSKDVAVNLMAYLGSESASQDISNSDARVIYEALEMDSPQSTKQIKVASELQGKFFESRYNKAMKVLWESLLVVGFGEVQDSAFPSLAVGTTALIFEDLWLRAQKISKAQAAVFLEKKLGSENLFWKFAQKL